MKDFGTTLCTRQSGRMVFDDVVAAFNRGDRIEFDFDGVASVTNSFADELFGRLALEFGMEELKARTTFVNVDHSSARSIRSVIDRRLAARV